MKNTKLRNLLILLTALFLISTLISCSAQSGGSADRYYPNTSDKSESMGGINSDGTTSSKPESGELYERKIIRTVDMSCETKAFDAATEFILGTLSTYGGYVETSSVSGTGYRENDRNASARYATYTLRVPAENLDAYLAALRADEGIRIIKQSSASNEITGTYYDISTRIATLEIERDSLQQMLAGFTDYSDIKAMLSVQERLYNVIEEIEALKTQLKIYDNQVDLSTINLSINEVFTYTEAATPTFGERIGEAFSDSWTNFADNCQDFAVFFVSALPTLLVLGVIAAVVITIVMASTRKHRKKQSPPNDHP
ncbi:MAG: DUF4349 domain-containing protein [Clostridia bacterium]|nr:DUF4349 domain-containing protein [Clostridia bacterium]